MNHICLHTESEEPSGMGRLMLILALALRSQCRFSFVCPPSAGGDRLLEEAAALGLNTFAPTTPEDFRAWLTTQQVDLVHHHAGIGWEGHAGVYSAHEANIPVVRTEHLPYLITEDWQQAEHLEMLQALERLVCVSNGAYETFVEAGVPTDKLCVVQNGILPPITTTTRQETREKLFQESFTIPTDAPLFLSVGRFAPQKNYGILLQAIPIVLQQHPNAHWLLVGTGQLWEEMKRLAEDLNLTQQVHFAGSRQDVPDLMQAADALVVPSLFEGLPLIVLEAMALRLPVIGSDVCGIAETVRDGVTGRLVPVNDVAALAAAMCEILGDFTLVTTWATAGYNDFLSHWTAQRMATDMQKVYQEVLKIKKLRNFDAMDTIDSVGSKHRRSQASA